MSNQCTALILDDVERAILQDALAHYMTRFYTDPEKFDTPIGVLNKVGMDISPRFDAMADLYSMLSGGREMLLSGPNLALGIRALVEDIVEDPGEDTGAPEWVLSLHQGRNPDCWEQAGSDFDERESLLFDLVKSARDSAPVLLVVLPKA
jgi:hypothetical protein